jgi:uncharacterized membrane protein
MEDGSRAETPAEGVVSPAAIPGGRRRSEGTQRLEAMSDAVIAIAITLLVLEIHVPEEKGNAELARALMDQWPSYFGFALSFLTIGIVWANHHDMFRNIARVDHLLVVLNLLLLMGVSFIPFSTAVLAEHLEAEDGRLVATILYGSSFLFTAVLLNVIWYYASWNRRLIAPDVSERHIHGRSVRYVVGPLFYGLTLPLAMISPLISLTVYAVVAAIYLIPVGD